MTALTPYAQEVSDLVLGTRDQFERMAGSSLQFEKEAGFAIQLLTGNDYALSIARSNKQSVINAVTNVAAIGISLNPARKQAYLVPRDSKICLDISYMGLLDIAIQSGSILWGQAEIVHASDKFELHGFDKPPMHARNPFDTDRGAIVGAYVVVKTRDGDYLTTAMPIKDIYDIRDRSSAWKAWVTKQKKCPWVTDEGEMIKKTVIKRAYKLWPKTDRLDTAVHHLNTDGEEGIEFTSTEAPTNTVKKITAASAATDAMGDLPTDQQEYLRELAMNVIAAFESPESGVGIAFDLVKSENLESEQTLALWSCLPSNVRSALKKEGQERKTVSAM